MHYFIDVMKKYCVFNGRASRREYWMFYLWYIIILSFLSMIFSSVLSSVAEEQKPMMATIIFIIMMIFFIGTFLPNLGVSIRRLHDISKSGWWILISFIPFIGGIWFLILLMLKGDTGLNKYGPDPYGVTSPAPTAPDNQVIETVSTPVIESSKESDQTITN